MADRAAFARQLARPSGRAGGVVAAAMDLANRRAVAASIAALAPRPGEHVLDLGCGTGRAAASIARTGARVTGIDHSPLMVETARRRCGDRATIAAAEFDRLPLNDAGVDAVFACNTLYFWHDEAAILGELRRVLRPDGRSVAYVTAGSAIAKLFGGKSETHRSFGEAELMALVPAFGLRTPSVSIAPLATFGVMGFVIAIEGTSRSHA